MIISTRVFSYLPVLFISTSFLVSCASTAVPKSEDITARTIELGPPIDQLKEGFLLVRLRSVEKQMQILRQKGKRTASYRLRNEAKLKNALVVKAFSENFKFAPVYFFYSKHSGKIRLNELDSIVVGDDFLPIEQELLKDKTFLVAEFAEIQPPANGAGLPALIVMDNQLHQLKKPFPFYVRTAVLGDEEIEALAVKQLEKNLQQHYEARKKKK